MRITGRERTAFREQGYVILGRALEPAAVRQLQLVLEEWAEKSGAGGPYGILKNNLWREVECVAQLIRAGALASMARKLLEVPGIVLFQDNLVWKSPGATRIEWHQDYSYWPLDAPLGATMWIALDDADVDNGCLHYIPGTHHLGECRPADFIVGTRQPTRSGLPPLEWRARQHTAVAPTVAAGEVLAHHPLVWHMSPANVSLRPRRALTLSWILPQVRWDPGHAPHPYNHRLNPAKGARVEGDLFPRFGDAGVAV